MTSARGTNATSPCASPDGTAYPELASRRSAAPPTGIVIDHGGGGGGSSAGSSSDGGGVGLGGEGGGRAAAGSVMLIVVAVAKPGRSRNGWARSEPASRAPAEILTSEWSARYAGSTANNRAAVGAAPSADTTTSADAKRSTRWTPGTVTIWALTAAM